MSEVFRRNERSEGADERRVIDTPLSLATPLDYAAEASDPDFVESSRRREYRAIDSKAM